MNEEIVSSKALFRRRVELEERRKRLEAELKETEALIAKMHEPLLMYMAQQELRNIPLTSGEMIVPRTSFFCSKKKDVNSDAVVEALQLLDLPFLTYSASKLKAWVKEQVEEAGNVSEILDGGAETVLPQPLRKVLKIYEETITVVMGAKPEERSRHE